MDFDWNVPYWDWLVKFRELRSNRKEISPFSDNHSIGNAYFAILERVFGPEIYRDVLKPGFINPIPAGIIS